MLLDRASDEFGGAGISASLCDLTHVSHASDANPDQRAIDDYCDHPEQSAKSAGPQDLGLGKCGIRPWA
jgi:hypothetical protein